MIRVEGALDHNARGRDESLYLPELGGVAFAAEEGHGGSEAEDQDHRSGHHAGVAVVDREGGFDARDR